MIEYLWTINNRASYGCSWCGAFLFSDDGDPSYDIWKFCPYCGAPLYKEDVGDDAPGVPHPLPF